MFLCRLFLYVNSYLREHSSTRDRCQEVWKKKASHHGKSEVVLVLNIASFFITFGVGKPLPLQFTSQLVLHSKNTCMIKNTKSYKTL